MQRHTSGPSGISWPAMQTRGGFSHKHLPSNLANTQTHTIRANTAILGNALTIALGTPGYTPGCRWPHTMVASQQTNKLLRQTRKTSKHNKSRHRPPWESTDALVARRPHLAWAWLAQTAFWPPTDLLPEPDLRAKSCGGLCFTMRGCSSSAQFALWSGVQIIINFCAAWFCR